MNRTKNPAKPKRTKNPLELSSFWTITVKMSVCCTDDKEAVIGIAQRMLPEILDGSDFMSIDVVDAQRED